MPPTLPEVYAAIKKIRSGKSPGVCGVYPEYLHYAGPEAMRLLVELFAQVWESEIVPDDWHQGIIVPIYKGKGSRSDCKNYRGITLLSMPGKVFAHVILARIKPALLACRRPEQSGFTRRCTMTRTAMQKLDHRLWRSHIATSTKLHLYNTYILPIMLYASECWTVNKADVLRIYTLDQW